MAKKELTATQKKNKYRVLQYTTFVSQFVSLLTPFIIMGAVNFDDWFKSEDGWKVGLGGTLALALMGLAVFLVTKNKEDKKMTDGYITLILGWFLVAFIFVLLASIMEQIATIMFFGGIGLAGAFGLNLTSKSLKKKADLYQSAISEAKTDLIKEEAKKEIEKELPIE